MLYLIKMLILGHVHQWKETAIGSLEQEEFGGGKSKGVRVFCTCEKCGLPVKFDLV